MVFSSLEFIFVFLPIFLIVYYAIPNKCKNYVLLSGSIIFYIVGSIEHPWYVVLLLISVIINYILGIQMKKYLKHKKKILITGIVYNLGWLFLFKYYDFLISIISNIVSLQFDRLELILPIGISFYTFQTISYLVDVYKEKYEPEKSIIKFATFILMFPKLISGPITTYDQVKDDLENRTHSIDKIADGCKFFIIGLGFKVLLADKIGGLWNEILMLGCESISTPLAWMGILAYSLQIYFDFYGYTLMARGIGKMIGFELPENFRMPYLSLSMTEFFRKWHMSLGNWFKNYVYIPLGGNRKGLKRTILNLFIVWILTGLWHGANYNFILWGIVICIMIVIEKVWLKNKLEKYPVLGHIYMFLLIPLTWTIFAITDLSQLGIMYAKLFPFFGTELETLNKLDFIKYIKIYGILLVVGIFCCTKLSQKILFRKDNKIIDIVLMLVIFWVSVHYLYEGLNNPFLYFSF